MLFAGTLLLVGSQEMCRVCRELLWVPSLPLLLLSPFLPACPLLYLLLLLSAFPQPLGQPSLGFCCCWATDDARSEQSVFVYLMQSDLPTPA